MTVFLILGIIGFVVLVAGLLLGELLDGAVDVVVPGDAGPGVVPALGAAVSAFGFGAALALRSGDMSAEAAVAAGAAGAVVVGVASFFLARSLIGDPVPPPRMESLYGVFGVVITPIPAGGYGEIAVVVHGSHQKFAARAEQPLPARTSVYVLEVLSSTSVLVAPADPTLVFKELLP
jgi:hypothetical protein